MNLNQLHTQSTLAPLSSVQRLWQQVQPLVAQMGQSLSQRLTQAEEPQVVIDCDRNNQPTFRVYDPYNGKRYTFTSEAAARTWLEKGRFEH